MFDIRQRCLRWDWQLFKISIQYSTYSIRSYIQITAFNAFAIFSSGDWTCRLRSLLVFWSTFVQFQSVAIVKQLIYNGPVRPRSFAPNVRNLSDLSLPLHVLSIANVYQLCQTSPTLISTVLLYSSALSDASRLNESPITIIPVTSRGQTNGSGRMICRKRSYSHNSLSFRLVWKWMAVSDRLFEVSTNMYTVLPKHRIFAVVGPKNGLEHAFTIGAAYFPRHACFEVFQAWSTLPALCHVCF